MTGLAAPTPAAPAPPVARPALLGLVAAATAAVDLVTKVIGSAVLAGGPIDLPGPIDLRLVHNTGVAFGVGSALPAGAMVALTAAVAVVVAVLAARGALGSPLAAGLVVGGALANVADRLVGGSVVDVFDLGWWPTFNVADVAITVGAGLLALSAWRAGPTT
ncbi:MAG: signal peptidase II, partial [Acidimicrobiales bacterium]